MAKFDLSGAVAAWSIAEAALGENQRLLQEANRALRDLTEELALDHTADEWWSEADTREEKEQVEAQIAALTRQGTQLEGKRRQTFDEVVIAKLELEALWDAVPDTSKTAIRVLAGTGFGAPLEDTGWFESAAIPGLRHCPSQHRFSYTTGADRTGRPIAEEWCRVEKTCTKDHEPWLTALKERLSAAKA